MRFFFSQLEHPDSKSQEGLLASTHSSFAFLPISTFTPPAEVARLKAELKNSTAFDSTSGLKKQHKLYEEWFDDERHAQLEYVFICVISSAVLITLWDCPSCHRIITYPVR